MSVTSETRDGPTPNGGVRSVAYYLNDTGIPTEKSQATYVKIEELDASGSIVHRTYASLTQE